MQYIFLRKGFKKSKQMHNYTFVTFSGATVLCFSKLTLRKF